MSAAMELLLIYLLLMNLIAFFLYGIDKWKAKKHVWRIPESTLLLSAAMGGALGAYLGMKVFHHKTLHTSFRIIVPLSLVVWIVILGCIFLH